MQQAKSATCAGASQRIQPFRYPDGPDAPALPEWTGWADTDDAEEDAPKAPAAPARDAGEIEARLRAEFDLRLAEEKRRAFEAGREQGRQAEHEAEGGLQAAAQRERVQHSARLIENFAQERERYMAAVEPEVVKLALAVAARILRREAQMDPLLLTGAVRVALGQLAGSTQVRLRVPPAELELWREAIALVPNLAVKPTVDAKEGMRLGDCEIETESGSADLGIRAQLGEIERGFFDRVGGSKGSGSGSSALSSNPGGSGCAPADLAGAAGRAEQVGCA